MNGSPSVGTRGGAVRAAPVSERRRPAGHGVRRRLTRLAVARTRVFAALATAATPAAAQTTGRLLGVVVDAESGEPLRAAEVSVPPLPMRTLTGEDGRFVLVGVPVGDRSLMVRMLGFEDLVLENVPVRAGQQAELRIEMRLSPA